jgi:hypothetical protein
MRSATALVNFAPWGLTGMQLNNGHKKTGLRRFFNKAIRRIAQLFTKLKLLGL